MVCALQTDVLAALLSCAVSRCRDVTDDPTATVVASFYYCCCSQTLKYIVTRHSRSELARYLFYCMFFCLFFVRSMISQQPAGRFTPNFACGRSLGRDVSSPLLGVSDPRGGKKRGNEIRVVSFLNRTATISVYLSVTKCGRICRAHTCTHSGVEP